ncbi:MAG: hypothetical protein ABIK92_05000, partial [Pseudomonadota bacterium]
MAIFRCNKCGHIREVGSEYIGKAVKCPKCDNATIIYDTVAFLQVLIKKHVAQTRELYEFRNEFSVNNAVQETYENPSLKDIDIHNTNIFTQDNSFVPIIQ